MNACSKLVWFILIYSTFGPKWEGEGHVWDKGCDSSMNVIENDNLTLKCTCTDHEHYESLECQNLEDKKLFAISGYFANN